MENLAFRVNVIEGQEQFGEACFQKLFTEQAGRIPTHDVSPAIPHGLLDETMMYDTIVTWPFESEGVQGSANMGISRMQTVSLAQSLVHFEFFQITTIAGVNLQSHVLVFPRLGSVM